MTYKKWQSRRWWIAIWAMLGATAIIVVSLVKGSVPDGLPTIFSVLAGIIGGYIAADSLTKPKQ
jgi:hypothetical protein